MARGGYRAGAGRPRGGKSKAPQVRFSESADAGPIGSETPVDYMLRIMNDPKTEAYRRDRMAVAAAPYLHPKVSDTGKKESKQEAAEAATAGRFGSISAPRLVVNNAKH